MRIAIVTPYCKEPESTLRRCLESVGAQSVAVTHIVVADGNPQRWLDAEPVRHLRLDRAHEDAGNTARGLGATLAVAEEFDAVGFLDADNWFERDHVSACIEAGMVDLPRPDFVIARRRMVRADGSELELGPTEDASGIHVDTNCYFIMRGAFHTLPIWATIPKPLGGIGDRIYLAHLRSRGLRGVTSDHVTVNYLCTVRSAYLAIGEEPPEYAKAEFDMTAVRDWWAGLEERQRRIVRRLVGFPIEFR